MNLTQDQIDKARAQLEEALKRARGAPQPINSMVWLLDGLCRAGVELLSTASEEVSQ